MNRIEQRLEKLERHAEKHQDFSGRLALTEANRRIEALWNAHTAMEGKNHATAY